MRQIYRAVKKYTDFVWLNPSDAAYSKYFKDRLPFCFRSEHINKGLEVLNKCKFSYIPFSLFVQYFLPNFTKHYTPSIPTLILSGDDDYICPPSLFKDSLITDADNISIKIIKGSGHFPWIDTPYETVSAFKDWYETFNRSPTTTA